MTSFLLFSVLLSADLTQMSMVCFTGEEDQGYLPHYEHVQLGHDPALPDSRVLVSCGGPGRNTAGSHEGNGKLMDM